MNEYQSKLKTHLMFLTNSSASYDNGDHEEALRISVSLRVIFYDDRKGSSTSLLSHLNKKRTIKLYSTFDKTEKMKEWGIAPVAILPLMATSQGVRPPLGDWGDGVLFNVKDWLEEVIWKENGISLRRWDIIDSAANQDGGAHVDSEDKLSNNTKKLRRGFDGKDGKRTANGMTVSLNFKNHHYPLLRQFAHEVLTSIELTSLADEDLEETGTLNIYTQLLLNGEYKQICLMSKELNNDVPKDILAKALGLWGFQFQQRADAEKNEYLFHQAFAKYDELTKLMPKSVKAEVFYNWGVALVQLKCMTGEQGLLESACEKFEMAANLNPNLGQAYIGWGLALMQLWSSTRDYTHLKVAETVLPKALRFAPEDAYNMACLTALRNEGDLCETHLSTCLKAGTLPSKEHLNSDTDLDTMRDKRWFIDFLKTVKS